MSDSERCEIKEAIHALEIRIVKLEQLVVFGGGLLGIMQFAFQIWSQFHK